MKRTRSGLVLVAALAALVGFTGCEQISVDTRVCPSGKIIREVVVTAPKEEAETVRRMIEPLLREKGFRHVRTQNEAVVRWVCKVNVRKNRALFQADFSRVTPFLCPVGKYHYEETVSLAKYLTSDQAKLVARSTQITYRFWMPGHLIAESCTAKNAATGMPLKPRLHQSDRLFATYSDVAWTAAMDEPIQVSIDSKGRRNFVILFWLVVLGVLGYLSRGVPSRLRVWRQVRAEKAERARVEKARKRAEKQLRKAEKARAKEERRRRKQRAREEQDAGEPAAPAGDLEPSEWSTSAPEEAEPAPEAGAAIEPAPEREGAAEPEGEEEPEPGEPAVEAEPTPGEPAASGEPETTPEEASAQALEPPGEPAPDEPDSDRERGEELDYTVTVPDEQGEPGAPPKRRWLFRLFRRKE